MAIIADIMVEEAPTTYLKLYDKMSVGARRKKAQMPPMPPPQSVISNTTFEFNAERMTLQFPLKPRRDLAAPIREQGEKKGFGEKKNNLQFTVIGFSTGKLIARAIKPLNDDDYEELMDEIETLVRQTNWNWSVEADENGQPQYWELSRAYPETVNRKDGKGKYTRQNRRQSVTLLIHLPGLAGFYDKLETLVNEATGAIGQAPITLPRPLPHITLLVKGRCRDGIGISCPADFENFKVKRW